MHPTPGSELSQNKGAKHQRSVNQTDAAFPRLLAEALQDPLSKLGKQLSVSQRILLREFYLPDGTRTRFKPGSRVQILANGRTALLSKLRRQGISRQDLRLGLERVRYLSFSDAVEGWITSAERSLKIPPPPAISFDIGERAYAKPAFHLLCAEWGVPPLAYQKGTITPEFNPKFGFTLQVRSGSQLHTFLIALPNGVRLAPIPQNYNRSGKSGTSPNRHLTNLMTLTAPVDLRLAFLPREIVDAGTPRLNLFCGDLCASLGKSIPLPSTLRERTLTPMVDITPLMNGERQVKLHGKHRIEPVAIVTIDGTRDAPRVKVALGEFVQPSKFTRARPFAAYLAGKEDALPPPLTLEIRRRELAEGRVHQRVFLGDQMTAPTWYPLPKLTVHCLVSPDGKRYLGQYPIGVSPHTTPPMRAFSLDPETGRWLPEKPDTVWTPPTDLIARTHTLLKDTISNDTPTSREAWSELTRLAQEHPVLMHALLCARHSIDSLRHESEELSEVKRRPGWVAFQSNLKAGLLPLQASSAPFVADTLAQTMRLYGDGSTSPFARCPDLAFILPTEEISNFLITRMLVVAEQRLASTVRLLQESPISSLRLLVTRAEEARILPPGFGRA